MLAPNQMTTNKVRLSYVHLAEPRSNNGGDPKYSTTVLMPKSDLDGKARLDAAYREAMQNGVTDKWNGTMPPLVACPIYDGDGVRPNGEPFGAECKGCWVFTASSRTAVLVVDAAQNPIIDSTEVYSGCYARVCVSFFPYNSNGKRGIGCGLEAVQKIEDGDPLGSGVSVADAFGAFGQAAPQQYAAAAPVPQQYAQSTAPVPQQYAPLAAPAPQAYQMPPAQHPNGAAYDPITGTYGW